MAANRLIIYVATCVFTLLSAAAQTQVQDIFGRSLNQRGITLIDWDGYVANPLIKFYVLPPTNATLPGTATLMANGVRLYFDMPSTVSTNGPSKDLSFTTTNAVAARLSIFPDRDGSNELYTLTLVFSDANNLRQTNTVPIQVMDLDLQRTNEFKVTVNFDRDITGFFTNADRRAIVQCVVDDWSYFFSGMNLDPVPIGAETTYIWSNNFDGGYYFVNTNAYTGYMLYAYGTSNSVHRSGGEGSYAGGAQTSGGNPLTIQRSGGFEAEIYGNYNTLFWLFSTNDDEWLVTGNLGDETNDFFSIAHHETGHALIFNEAHSGFAAAKANGAFTSPDVTNYYGDIVPIDGSDHLNGAIDPESGQGAFGYEYYGDIPRKRWIFTKLDLLCAQEVGYVLRTNAMFNPLAFPSNGLPAAAAGIYFSNTFTASGGLMSYCWDTSSGALPPGLALDSFSGSLAGTPSTNGTFNFTVRVRDYHEGGTGISHGYTLIVSTARPQLAVSAIGAGASQQILVQLTGAAGQQQVLQASTNLTVWLPVTTNFTGTNLFQFIDTNSMQFPWRFYRAQVLP